MAVPVVLSVEPLLAREEDSVEEDVGGLLVVVVLGVLVMKFWGRSN